jgi:hypothetical protein
MWAPESPSRSRRSLGVDLDEEVLASEIGDDAVLYPAAFA